MHLAARYGRGVAPKQDDRNPGWSSTLKVTVYAATTPFSSRSPNVVQVATATQHDDAIKRLSKKETARSLQAKRQAVIAQLIVKTVPEKFVCDCGRFRKGFARILCWLKKGECARRWFREVPPPSSALPSTPLPPASPAPDAATVASFGDFYPYSSYDGYEGGSSVGYGTIKWTETPSAPSSRGVTKGARKWVRPVDGGGHRKWAKQEKAGRRRRRKQTDVVVGRRRRHEGSKSGMSKRRLHVRLRALPVNEKVKVVQKEKETEKIVPQELEKIVPQELDLERRLFNEWAARQRSNPDQGWEAVFNRSDPESLHSNHEKINKSDFVTVTRRASTSDLPSSPCDDDLAQTQTPRRKSLLDVSDSVAHFDDWCPGKLEESSPLGIMNFMNELLKTDETGLSITEEMIRQFVTEELSPLAWTQKRVNEGVAFQRENWKLELAQLVEDQDIDKLLARDNNQTTNMVFLSDEIRAWFSLEVLFRLPALSDQIGQLALFRWFTNLYSVLPDNCIVHMCKADLESQTTTDQAQDNKWFGHFPGPSSTDLSEEGNQFKAEHHVFAVIDPKQKSSHLVRDEDDRVVSITNNDWIDICKHGEPNFFPSYKVTIY